MNWYGTWIEMRGGALLLGGFLLISSLAADGPFRALTAESWRWFPWQQFFGTELSQMPLARTIGDDVLVWAEFAGRIATIAFGGPLMFGFAMFVGDKFSAASREPALKWTTYALTLPISRAKLVVTRFLVSVAALAMTGVGIALAVAAFWVRGQHVPLGPVVESLALAVMCSAMVLATVYALVISIPSWWALLTIPPIFVLFTVPTYYIVAAPGRAEVPWASLVVCPIITCAALCVAISRAKAREY